MLLELLIIITIVGGIIWYVYSTPSVPGDPQSQSALDNISRWFSSQLGPRWPLILMVIIALLIIILLLTSNCVITFPAGSTKVIALAVLALGIWLTYKLRLEYLSQNYGTLGISPTQYYVEFGLIIVLLAGNMYMLWN